MISPLCRNIDLEEADIAGIAKYCLAKIAKIGNLLQSNCQ